VELLNRAKAIVRGSVLYRRFIDHTPLENDIAVWMADFAGQVLHEHEAAQTPALPPDTPDALKALERYIEWFGAVHDDECPADDTCSCSWRWVNEGVNAAFRALSRGQTPESLVVYPADFKPGAPRPQGLWVESAPPAEEPRRPEPPKKV
jgi:hypothetical protein